MQRNSSSLDHSRLEDTETFLSQMYPRLVIKAHEQGDIQENMRDHLLTRGMFELDELEECYNELVKCIKNKQFYQLVDRIEKAEVVIEQEKDLYKKQFYIKKMKELAAQLEGMGPA